MAKKSVEKQKIRESIVSDYQKGMAIDDLMKKYNKTKKQVVGVLVYMGVYQKENSEREKVIKVLVEKGFSKNELKRIPTAFLKKVLEKLS